MYRERCFRLIDDMPGLRRYHRLLAEAKQEVTVTRVAGFDYFLRSDAVPGTGWVVTNFDATSKAVLFEHRIPDGDDVFVNHEQAFLLAAAVEASLKLDPVSGADVLAGMLGGRRGGAKLLGAAHSLLEEDHLHLQCRFPGLPSSRWSSTERRGLPGVRSPSS
ncbi:hypothetical protein [Roseivivax sp. CAU 1761]